MTSLQSKTPSVLPSYTVSNDVIFSLVVSCQKVGVQGTCRHNILKSLGTQNESRQGHFLCRCCRQKSEFNTCCVATCVDASMYPL